MSIQINKNKKFNILDFLLIRHLSHGLKDKIAVIDENNVISYGDLLRAVINFPSIIPNILIVPQQTIVACIIDDSIESVIVFLSLIYYGLVPCNINPKISDSAYDCYLKNISTNFIIIEQKYYKKFQNYIQDNLISHAVLENSSIETLLKGRAKKSYLMFSSDENSKLFCVYTSGTTGHPSAVLHRHKDVKVMNDNYAATILKVKKSDKLFSTSKMFFAYGLNNLMIALYHGTTAILSPKNNEPTVIWQTIHDHKPSIFFSVPTMYNKLLNNSSFCSIPSNMICVSAGEPLPEKLFNNWKNKYGTYIIDGIGCSEVLSTFISNTQDKAIPNSAGKPVDGFRCVIKNHEGNELGDNKVGTLWVYGDTYPTCYLNNKKATEERFVNGWFNTHDLFYRNEDGFFYHQGRLNDLIYKNGVWVFPARIEGRINAHSNVRESIVIDYRAEANETNLVAFLVINGNIATNDLYRDVVTLNEKNAYYQPEENINLVCLVNEIPKTYTGKFKRYELRKLKIWDGATQMLQTSQKKYDLVIDMRE